MTKFGTAQPVRRVEDPRLLTGQGRYTDDISLPGQVHGHVLRSPHAFARLRGIDAAAARQAPGVLAVYTFADLEADGIGPLPCIIPLKNRDGSPRHNPPRFALAGDMVRHVGDGVAFVVAETLAQARDAADLIEVAYEPLQAVVSATDAMAEGAPQLWPDVPGNTCFDWASGDEEKAREIFAGAAHVTRLDLVNNRVVVASIEGRAALAAYDGDSGRFTLYTNTQGSHLIKRLLADAVYRLPADRFRVVTPDVGGGFGMKLYLYPEQVLVTYAARKLGRPVKWANERSESFLSDTQGRDQTTVAELALDSDGRFLGLRVDTLANLGGYLSTFAPLVPTAAGSKVLSVVYRIPAIFVHVRGIMTNTVPVDAYRGAGRPESNFLVERLVDKAAAEMGIEAIELRRRNFIPPEALPYTTATGVTYDSGAFEQTMDMALEAADWAGFPARAEAARSRGSLRGIGLACYLEATQGPSEERAEIRFAADGMVDVLVGTQSTGQGHETAYTQLVSDRLGVPFERIRVLQGDSDIIRTGGGTGGARSLYSEGGAILGAVEEIIEKGRQMAGHLLEAAATDIEFDRGSFRITGTDRAIGLLEVAAAARDPAHRPPEAEGDLDTGLDAGAKFTAAATFPNGCHVAEVEIDEETGAVKLVGYTVVDDMGRVVNPMIVAGQAHGGIAQGVGQALLEHTVYDESGQLLSGSLMDYCLPRADDLPPIRFALHEVPCRTNPLGVKGAGEAGAVGSPPAVINAVVNALSGLGVRHLDMPATPERVWNAIRQARAG